MGNFLPRQSFSCGALLRNCSFKSTSFPNNKSASMAGHSKWSKVKRFKGALQCTFPTGSYDPIAGSLLLWLPPVMALLAVVAGPDQRRQTETRIVTSPMVAPLSTTGETPPMKGQVPQAILDPILKKAAALAKVDREQLVIVRAKSVVWNDGSLGCPEPGMMYTQALVTAIG
jgi:hypothetical protein